jgi:hypothetical protein
MIDVPGWPQTNGGRDPSRVELVPERGPRSSALRARPRGISHRPWRSNLADDAPRRPPDRGAGPRGQRRVRESRLGPLGPMHFLPTAAPTAGARAASRTPGLVACARLAIQGRASTNESGPLLLQGDAQNLREDPQRTCWTPASYLARPFGDRGGERRGRGRPDKQKKNRPAEGSIFRQLLRPTRRRPAQARHRDRHQALARRAAHAGTCKAQRSGSARGASARQPRRGRPTRGLGRNAPPRADSSSRSCGRSARPMQATGGADPSPCHVESASRPYAAHRGRRAGRAQPRVPPDPPHRSATSGPGRVCPETASTIDAGVPVRFVEQELLDGRPPRAARGAAPSCRRRPADIARLTDSANPPGHPPPPQVHPLASAAWTRTCCRPGRGGDFKIEDILDHPRERTRILLTASSGPRGRGQTSTGNGKTTAPAAGAGHRPSSHGGGASW